MHLFGVLVAIGVLLGRHVVIIRAKSLGVADGEIKRTIDWVLILGFAMAHWIEVGLYHPQWIDQQGWLILFKFWNGLSSYGGFFGAFLGLVLATRGLKPGSMATHADCLMQGIVVGWVFGRLGCTFALDHPGALTDSWIGFRFHDGSVRHNLGFYEFLLTVFLFLPMSYGLHKKFPKDRLQAPVVGLTYGVLRFGLDFFRAPDAERGDVRYGWLTPAQYFSIAVILYGLTAIAMRVAGPKKRR
jgi:phosphatidylglycerol:prolipoprotein diacylglycerol transferase